MVGTVLDPRTVFPGNGFLMRGHIIYPKRRGRYPSLIVHPGASGLTGGIVDLGRTISRQGYVVLIVDLYSFVPEEDLPKERAFGKLVKYSRQLVDHGHLKCLDKAVNYLQSLPVVDPKRIVILGFCSPHPLVFACHSLEIKACVSFYNQLVYRESSQDDVTVSPLDRIPSLWCPWQGHYGEDDALLPQDQRDLLINTAATHKKSVELYVYEGCGHGFAEPFAESYCKDSAQLAWQRTFEFLALHLGS